MTECFSIFLFNLFSSSCGKAQDCEMTIESEPDIYIHEVEDFYPDIIETIKTFPQESLNNEFNVRTNQKINLNDYPNKISQFEGIFKVYLSKPSEKKDYMEYCFTDNEGYILQPGVKRKYLD